MGAKKTLNRSEAIEEYAILRLRFEDIKRLDYLLKAFYHKRIGLPDHSPFSTKDLADAIRTCFFGWFATLTDEHDRAVYAFNSLLALFPHRKAEIVNVQLSLEACHSELQQFRSNVAFHSRANIKAIFKARMKLREDDVFLDLQSAIIDFSRLMESLIAEEHEAIPELAEEDGRCPSSRFFGIRQKVANCKSLKMENEIGCGSRNQTAASGLLHNASEASVLGIVGWPSWPIPEPREKPK